MTSIVDRVVRKTGVPDLISLLAERLGASDLQSLLLEVVRRRAELGGAGELARRYAENRFVRPSGSDVRDLLEIDRVAFASLPEGFEAVELSPIAPLGATSIVTGTSQNRVVSTLRNTEVASDATNGLALECARRRAALLADASRSVERVRLCASQRLVRAQAYENESALAHFRLIGLCTAGRDQGSRCFELESLFEHVDFNLRFLEALRTGGARIEGLRASITPLPDGLEPAAVASQVLAPLERRHPEAEICLVPERERGRGYYESACFHVHAREAGGRWRELSDGGHTSWTRQPLSNRKERLMVSGIGAEAVALLFLADRESAARTWVPADG